MGNVENIYIMNNRDIDNINDQNDYINRTYMSELKSSRFYEEFRIKDNNYDNHLDQFINSKADSQIID